MAKKSKFLAENNHATGTTLNSTAPTIGAKPKESPQQASNNKTTKQEQQTQTSGSSGKNYVMNGAILKCMLCTVPEGQLMVTSNAIGLQGDLWATEADKTPENLLFNGTCRRSPFQASPCRAVIAPDVWQEVSDISLQGNKALLEDSIIICNYGGAEITIEDHLQISVPTQLENLAEAEAVPRGGGAAPTPPKTEDKSFNIIKLEGPFNSKKEKIDIVNREQKYIYAATLDKNPEQINLQQIKWAVSYDGETAQKSYYLFSGGYIEDGKVKVKIQIDKAKEKFKIYAYTQSLPDDNISVEVKIAVSLIDVTTNAGKYLFSLEPNTKHQAQKITAKKLYDKGIQWFCPYADNYLKFVKKDTNLHTFKELKHFSWNDISNFAEVDRWNLKYRAGGSGDWKSAKDGADGFFLISVGEFPYWADAIGQIPFSVDIFKENLESEGKIEQSIKATLKTGEKFGDGKIIGGQSDNSNSYDNHIIVRACIWASKRYKAKETNNWYGGKSINLEKTNHASSNLSHFISEQDYNKYLK